MYIHTKASKDNEKIQILPLYITYVRFELNYPLYHMYYFEVRLCSLTAVLVVNPFFLLCDI